MKQHMQSANDTPQRNRTLFLGFISGAIAGAAAMYVMDPQSGRRRQALARDKAVKARNTIDQTFTDDLPKRLDYLSGFIEGARYRAKVAMEGGSDRRPENEHVLVDRVQSSVFRDPEIPKGDVNIDAEGTTVYLRGSVESDSLAQEIERRVRDVEGVDDVVNLINNPDADPSEIRAV